MDWHASLTVALGGRLTGSWFLTISDIFLMDQGLCWGNLSDVWAFKNFDGVSGSSAIQWVTLPVSYD